MVRIILDLSNFMNEYNVKFFYHIVKCQTTGSTIYGSNIWDYGNI